MNKIYTLKEYNAKAYSKYVVAVNEAIKNQSEFRPTLSRYLLNRATGYVVVIGDEAKYFGSKAKANQYVIEIESEK